MAKAYKVSYNIGDYAVRRDIFETMEDGSEESAFKAILNQFSGYRGVSRDTIKINEIVGGHYEYQPRPRFPFIQMRVFIED